MMSKVQTTEDPNLHAAYVYRGANARARLYECLIREGVDIDEILSRVQPNISLPARI